jgi:hypothetical protein
MIQVGLVEKSKNDPSLYVITQKGIVYRNQFNSFISIMERDLQCLQAKGFAQKELIADLNIKR